MSEIGVSIVGAAISRPRAETNISHKMLGKLVSLHEIAKPICKYRKLYRTGGRLPPLRQYRVFSQRLAFGVSRPKGLAPRRKPNDG